MNEFGGSLLDTDNPIELVRELRSLVGRRQSIPNKLLDGDYLWPLLGPVFAPRGARSDALSKTIADFVSDKIVFQTAERLHRRFAALMLIAARGSHWHDLIESQREIERLISTEWVRIIQTAPLSADDMTWLSDCIRCFNLPGTDFVTVPVASYKSGAHELLQSGRIWNLLLQVSEDSSQAPSSGFARRDSAQHPRERLSGDHRHGQAVSDAIEFALGFAKVASGKDGVTGYWRLCHHDGKPMEEKADGLSLGGAAARGWYHALLKKVPDERVLVLAEVLPDDRSWKLGPVGGWAPKCAAIFSQPNDIDTVVICSEAPTSVWDELQDKDKRYIDVFTLRPESSHGPNGSTPAFRILDAANKKREVRVIICGREIAELHRPKEAENTS